MSRPSGLLIDLDGTLLDPLERISPRVATAVKTASRLIPVALASGRVAEDVGHYARLLGLMGPQVSDNGARLLDPVTGRTLYERALHRSDASAIISHLEDAGARFFAVDSGRMVRNRQSIRDWRITVITAYVKDDATAIEMADGASSDGVSAIPSVGNDGVWYINYTRAGTDKGTGARQFAQLEGVDLSTVMAIGDGINDLEMFAAVGIPVAMGHARDHVKAEAMHIVGGIDQDGVAEAIERFVLG